MNFLKISPEEFWVFLLKKESLSIGRLIRKNPSNNHQSINLQSKNV